MLLEMNLLQALVVLIEIRNADEFDCSPAAPTVAGWTGVQQ